MLHNIEVTWERNNNLLSKIQGIIVSAIKDNRYVYQRMQQLCDSSDVCVFYMCVRVGVFYNPDKVIFANTVHDKSQNPRRYADRALCDIPRFT